MFSTLFSSHRINHGALVSKDCPKSTSMLKGLKLFTNAILRSTSTNSSKIHCVPEAILLMICYKFKVHFLSPCYILHHKAFAESCNRK